jgi:hypothetical protein
MTEQNLDPKNNPHDLEEQELLAQASFQIMPKEGGESANVTQAQEKPAQTEEKQVFANQNLNQAVPDSHSRHRLIFIIFSLIFIAALGVLAYFLVGPNKNGDDQGDIPQQITSRIPGHWMKLHFNVEVCDRPLVCGDDADPDNDGLTNYEEFRVDKGGTDPNNPDTDGDGLADGDEINVFFTDPTKKYSYCQYDGGAGCAYDDGVQIKNDYDPSTPGIRMSEGRKKQIQDNIMVHGLHEPSITTLSKDEGPSQGSDNSSE